MWGPKCEKVRKREMENMYLSGFRYWCGGVWSVLKNDVQMFELHFTL